MIKKERNLVAILNAMNNSCLVLASCYKANNDNERYKTEIRASLELKTCINIIEDKKSLKNIAEIYNVTLEK